MEENLDWIHDLVKAEQQMEETGVIDFGSNLDPERLMVGAALTFLAELRAGFNEALDVFNKLKTSNNGKVKIYGIAKTHADFMLFRNGFKLVFNLKQPGVISVRTHFINPSIPTVSSMNFIGNADQQIMSTLQFRGDEDLLEMALGAFNEPTWTFKGQAIKTESAIKYYLTKFLQDTANPGY
ncbi:MAG: hypothetical protein RJB66_1160 [Pseudomonadota bacterium]|jgi:hypothetical protein